MPSGCATSIAGYPAELLVFQNGSGAAAVFHALAEAVRPGQVRLSLQAASPVRTRRDALLATFRSIAITPSSAS